MKADATSLEKFEGWYERPIELLKSLPEDDGAFLAMSAALFLCERYYRTQTGTHTRGDDRDSFKKAAAKDLGLPLPDFELFWKVYRHGIQHQGMSKNVEDRMTNTEYFWEMHHSYGALPQMVPLPDEPRTVRVRIDPWKFASLICSKFKQSPAILEQQKLATTYDTYD